MRFNLDTGILVALVSSRVVGVRPWSWGSWPLFACQSVYGEFERIIRRGNPEEQEKAHELCKHLWLLRDIDDPTIPLSRKIQRVDRIFVATGRAYGFRNVTTDAKLARALRDNSIIVLPPRPLQGN